MQTVERGCFLGKKGVFGSLDERVHEFVKEEEEEKK
jgi:hypothetical protein